MLTRRSGSWSPGSPNGVSLHTTYKYIDERRNSLTNMAFLVANVAIYPWHYPTVSINHHHCHVKQTEYHKKLPQISSCLAAKLGVQRLEKLPKWPLKQRMVATNVIAASSPKPAFIKRLNLQTLSNWSGVKRCCSSSTGCHSMIQTTGCLDVYLPLLWYVVTHTP